MKDTKNIDLLKKYYNFLITTLNFKIKEVKNLDYALYAKFISSNVGICFSYEFRDYIPRIQISKIETGDLKERQGLYTIKELYKDNSFKLQSFYLDEILSFQAQKEYKSYFQDIKTIEDAIKKGAELLETYAMDYAKGDNASFVEMDKWFRKEVTKY